MNHTPQIKKAIQFAARKHHGQFRAETEPLPYITHLFSVALLVAEDGSDDDTVSAALLHDVLEDTPTTRAELAAEFGERVTALVENVTHGRHGDIHKPSWREKREQYLKNLQTAPSEALLIAMADKVDNIESKLQAFEKEGPLFLKRWTQPAEEYFWYHGTVLKMAQERLPEHLLTRRLAEACVNERAAFAST